MAKSPSKDNSSPEVSKLAITDLKPRTDASPEERGYPDDYSPEADAGEYMNIRQLAFFRDQLLEWRLRLERESQSTVQDLQNQDRETDPIDVGTTEYNQALELRTRDRGSKLIKKIDEALERIRTGNFGYCEETGDPIGIPRLMARPIATLSIEAKRRQEQTETGYAG